MRASAFTVAAALLTLAITWTLVRLDILPADAIRFLPAALACIVAGGIAFGVYQKTVDKRTPGKKTPKRRWQ
jgi:uncharacterized membrane protein YccC